MPLRLSDDSAFSPDKRRDLTPDELLALREIRLFWGPQNTLADVMFSDKEAVLFVKSRRGATQVMVVLTNAGKLLDGTFSLREVRRRIIGPLGYGRSERFIALMSFIVRIRGRIFGWDKI